MPVDNVYEKLAKDPMMTKTFDLGNQEHFNDDFKNTEEEFTYLVPTDKAWEEIQQEMATAHKVYFWTIIFAKLLAHILIVGPYFNFSFWPNFFVLNLATNQVLFMGEFFYQSEKILKRHLRVRSLKI